MYSFDIFHVILVFIFNRFAFIIYEFSQHFALEHLVRQKTIWSEKEIKSFQSSRKAKLFCYSIKFIFKNKQFFFRHENQNRLGFLYIIWPDAIDIPTEFFCNIYMRSSNKNWYLIYSGNILRNFFVLHEICIYVGASALLMSFIFTRVLALHFYWKQEIYCCYFLLYS